MTECESEAIQENRGGVVPKEAQTRVIVLANVRLTDFYTRSEVGIYFAKGEILPGKKNSNGIIRKISSLLPTNSHSLACLISDDPSGLHISPPFHLVLN